MDDVIVSFVANERSGNITLTVWKTHCLMPAGGRERGPNRESDDVEHYILFQTAKTSKKRTMGGGGDVSVEDSPSHPHPLFCHICIQLSECKYDDAIAPYRRAPSLRISILCARPRVCACDGRAELCICVSSRACWLAVVAAIDM